MGSEMCIGDSHWPSLGRGFGPFFRLDMYTVMPFSICRLCRMWFPTEYLRSCLDFLHVPADGLDLGFSLPFQKEAWAQGKTEPNRVTWLASDPVQAFLESLVLKLFVTSLASERKAAQVNLVRKVTGKLPAQPVKLGGQQNNIFFILAGLVKKAKSCRNSLCGKGKVTGTLPASQLAGRLPVTLCIFENSG